MTTKGKDRLVVWSGSLGITIIGCILASWLATNDLDARELNKKIDSKAEQTELEKVEERLQKGIDENKQNQKEFRQEYTQKIDRIDDYIMSGKKD